MGESERVPPEVDMLVEDFTRICTLLRAPGGVVLVGAKSSGDRSRWYDAANLEQGMPGFPGSAIAGPHKWAIISRLRRNADEAPQKAHADLREVVCKNDVWYLPDSTEVCPKHAALSIDFSQWSLNESRLGADSGYDRMFNPLEAVKATLFGSDVAYCVAGSKQRQIVIPCSVGATRKLLLLVQCKMGLTVFYVTVTRPAKARPQFVRTQKPPQCYFPVHDRNGVLRVIELPQQA